MSIGFHVNKSMNMSKNKSDMCAAIENCNKLLKGFEFKNICAQIFVSGPQSYDETLTKEEQSWIATYVRKNSIQLVIHGAYVDNPWNKNPRSIHNIKQEMKIARKLGATGVIVHLARGAADDANVEYVLAHLANLEDDIKNNVILWLETHTAKSSEYTYETPEKILKLFERIAAINSSLKIGLCIDTAHLFSCGCALTNYDTAKKWLAGISSLRVPIMIHLNDSKSKLNSGRDEHEKLLAGNLWGMFTAISVEDSGLNAILEWASSRNIVVILERDYDDLLSDFMIIHDLGYFQ